MELKFKMILHLSEKKKLNRWAKPEPAQPSQSIEPYLAGAEPDLSAN